MFNYADLSDVEFEYLAQDIMEKKLNNKLQRFPRGRDGGIDLTDDVHRKRIIVQVKHYINSSLSSLMLSLQHEIEKVNRHKPQQYYVVTSASLPAARKNEIYEMFSGFMKDASNIISREDIEDLLQSSEYEGVVKKHFKLWLHSTNILESIYCGDVLEDSQVFIESTRENEKFFVQTRAYSDALEYLESSRLLIVVGAPGVGKTVTCQMLVLKYISQGYRLRFTTDTTNINVLKKAISQNPDVKEVIFLDDCLGQYYFKMKLSQDAELVSLVKHIRASYKKVLILSSRLTILHEAQSNSHELCKCLDTDDIHIHIIDMSTIGLLDKAKILYNHFYFSGIPQEYFDAIKSNFLYRQIVTHKNYTPRIVEFITSQRNYRSVPACDYPQFIINTLNNPEEIWDNEYSYRIQQVDRLFLGTLFSLTDTLVDLDLMRRCFYYRLSQIDSIDVTEDNFRNCHKRLNKSMIRTVDFQGATKIGMINPSVNDYLKNRFARNEPERKAIITSIISIEQSEKMIENKEEFYNKRFIDKSILSFYFSSQKRKVDFIIAKLIEFEIEDKEYSSYIVDYINEAGMLIDVRGFQIMTLAETFKKLLDSKLYDYYQIEKLLENPNVISRILCASEFDELTDIINILYQKFIDTQNQVLVDLLESCCTMIILDSITHYGFSIDITEETERYDIRQIIENNDKSYYLSDPEYDVEGAAEELRNELDADIKERIWRELLKLPKSIYEKLPDDFDISYPTYEFEGIIEAALEPDYDDTHEHAPDSDAIMDEVDYMFQR